MGFRRTGELRRVKLLYCTIDDVTRRMLWFFLLSDVLYSIDKHKAMLFFSVDPCLFILSSRFLFSADPLL